MDIFLTLTDTGWYGLLYRSKRESPNTDFLFSIRENYMGYNERSVKEDIRKNVESAALESRLDRKVNPRYSVVRHFSFFYRKDTNVDRI